MTEEFEAGNSVLGSLKARREEILRSAVLDLAVPRWNDPAIHIKYKPVSHSTIRRALSMAEKATGARKAEAEVNGNVDVLIHGCVAVVARIDGKEYSLRPGDQNGEPTRFDEDLAAALGLDGEATARKIVRELFITEGDILSHAGQLVEWSGYREATADEEFEGE